MRRKYLLWRLKHIIDSEICFKASGKVFILLYGEKAEGSQTEGDGMNRQSPDERMD